MLRETDVGVLSEALSNPATQQLSNQILCYLPPIVTSWS